MTGAQFVPGFAALDLPPPCDLSSPTGALLELALVVGIFGLTLFDLLQSKRITAQHA